MKRLLRMGALAVFCAVWGFVGSLAAVWLLADEVRGDPGPPGPAGPPGDQGPTGKAPADLAMDVALLKVSDQNAEDWKVLVDNRLRHLEGRPDPIAITGVPAPPCLQRQVVTDVSVNPITGQLMVDRDWICAPVGP